MGAKIWTGGMKISNIPALLAWIYQMVAAYRHGNDTPAVVSRLITFQRKKSRRRRRAVPGNNILLIPSQHKYMQIMWPFNTSAHTHTPPGSTNIVAYVERHKRRWLSLSQVASDLMRRWRERGSHGGEVVAERGVMTSSGSRSSFLHLPFCLFFHLHRHRRRRRWHLHSACAKQLHFSVGEDFHRRCISLLLFYIYIYFFSHCSSWQQ